MVVIDGHLETDDDRPSTNYRFSFLDNFVCSTDHLSSDFLVFAS